MTVPSVTYRTLLNQVISWINTNCKNVGSNYSSLGAYYKSGNSETLATTYAASSDGGPAMGYGGKVACAQFTLSVSSGISQVAEGVPSNELASFFNGLYLPSNTWDYPIDSKNLYNFLYDLFLFCSFKIALATTAMPPVLATTTTIGINGNGNDQSWSSTSSRGSAIVYSTQSISTAGLSLDPRPAGMTGQPIDSNGVVVGDTRAHTLSGAEMQAIVNRILDNKLSRKIIVVSYTGSVTTL